MTVSVEWIEWRLWGENTLGYHLVRVGVHLLGALLLWRLLAKFNLRLAWLGGLLFAIHPAVVESVAWIAELKNTLSLAPFLLAACAWIDFDRDQKRRDYFLSLGCFIFAALCKSTMVMFPVVILLYAWWRRDRIGWNDVKVAVPFFVVSLVIGIVTVDFVHPLLGEKPMDAVSRFVLAGQAIAFYFFNSVWPVGLLPIYHKWIVDPSSPEQWLPWPALASVLAACWIRRAGWGRHALLGLGFFLINLAPFAGFSQAAYMGFTWVMDHMLYIPLIGLIGLFVAGLERLDGMLPGSIRPFAIWLVAIVMVGLGLESHTYAAMYGNPLALWTYAFRGNPDSWVVRINLGEALAQQGRLADAVAQFQAADQLDPNQGDVHADLGKAYNQMGRLPEALSEYETALKLKPKDANLPYALGNILVRLHRIPEATERYQQALQFDPRYFAAHYALGCILLGSNRVPEAIDHLQQALQIDPGHAEVHGALGRALLQMNQLPEAANQLQLAIQLAPNDAKARTDFGVALARMRQFPEALEQFEAVLKLDPNDVEARNNLGSIFLVTGRFPEAIEQYQAALRLEPGFVAAQKNLLRAQAMERALGTKTPPP